ncbi:MAG: deoxyribose-phosphate aldolase [Candidatus Kariarchaeaceae archaeon]|jgi:deoxyribose-phosphate aldolase
METKEASTTKSKELIKRNPGMPLELDWVNAIRVNKSAIERRVATLPKRRSIKKQWQAAWLLKAVSCIDLTTLAGDDTPGRVERLCHKARQPVRQDILEGFGVDDLNLTVGAVCVYHQMIPVALQALKDSEVPIAAVSTGFPDGLSPFEQRVEEIKASVAAGAEEIDIVITRQHVLTANWESLYSEIAAFREACGEAHLKVILGTGNLATLRNIAKASLVAMMAGADFIKTSTGKESENATLEVSLIMVRMIRDYYQRTGYKIGFKPAGGIRTAKQSLAWLALMKEELGNEWLTPALFRFGASSLLADIERQLSHNLTGRYSADQYHPMG